MNAVEVSIDKCLLDPFFISSEFLRRGFMTEGLVVVVIPTFIKRP